MKVICNGFNLYKKFETDKALITNFETLNYENVTDIEVSLTYAVIRKKDDLYVSGGNFNETKYVDYDFGTVKSISCANDNFFVLNEEGEIFQVNVANLNEIVEIKTKEILNSDDKLIQIAIGDKIKVGLSLFGRVFDIPRRLNFDVFSTIDLKIGGVHCLLLDSQGNVYSFGNGSRGQLGHGTLDDLSNPKQIEALAGIPIIAIACGTWHCVALSKDGDIYAWGWNQTGQLGLPLHSTDHSNGVSVMATPHVVDLPEPNSRAVQVACGKRHTILMLDNGKVYGCGMNKYNQLMEDQCEIVETMTFLGDFSKDKVKDIRCGPWNSILICD